MLLFYHGTIHTMDEKYPSPEAVLVGDDGRIRAIGALSEVKAAAPEAVQRVDLQGRTLLPGFNDAHVHVQWMGLMLTWMVNATITNAPDIPTIVDLYRQKAAERLAGEWVTGGGYNENFLPEKRHLTRYDLDEAST